MFLVLSEYSFIRDFRVVKKRTLFSKIQAVRAHESKRVSWASQLSLQALLLQADSYLKEEGPKFGRIFDFRLMLRIFNFLEKLE